MGDETGQRRPARGEPFPFSPQQVDALVRGVRDNREIRRLLESRQSPEPQPSREAPAAGCPVPISAREMSRIRAQGSSPRAVRQRIEAAEDRASQGEARPERKQAPDRPPRDE